MKIKNKKKNLELLILLFFFWFIFVLNCNDHPTSKSAKTIDPKELPYQLLISAEGQFDSKNVEYQIVDLDLNGISEKLTINRTNASNIKEIDHITHSNILSDKAGFQLNFNGNIVSVKSIDLDDDRTQELFVSEQRNDSLYVHIFNYNGNLISTFPTVTGKPKDGHPWAADISPIGMLDVNNDGKRDLLLSVYTFYAYQPRGIYAYNYLTGKNLWNYTFGPAPHNPKFFDIDNDGLQEIIVGTNAPVNGDGEKINGTDDSHSYLLLFNNKGENILTKELGNIFSTLCVYTKDMDHDHKPEMIILRRTRQLNPPQNSFIGFWDINNKRLHHKKEFDNELIDALEFIDYDSNGIDEFLVLWKNGLIEIRDIENNHVHSYTTGECPAFNKIILSDLNNDGNIELIVSYTTSLYIFNKQLKLLAKYPLSSPYFQLIETSPGNPKELFLTSKDKWCRLTYEKNIRANILNNLQLISYIIISFVLLTIIIIAFVFREKYKFQTYINEKFSKSIERGIIAFNKKGQLTFINNFAQEIFNFNGKNINLSHYTLIFKEPAYKKIFEIIEKMLKGELLQSQHQFEKNNNEKTRKMRLLIERVPGSIKRLYNIILIIDDVSTITKSQRAIAWAAMSQSLAHQIKTPLSSVMLAVQRLQMEYQRDNATKAETYNRYVHYIENEVRRVRQITDGFMKLSHLEKPKLHPENIVKIIKKCITNLENKTAKQILIETDFAKDLPIINIDKNQIMIAMKVLLDNADEAIENEGKISITIRLAQTLQSDKNVNDLNFIHIEIADTGHGIADDVKQNLFKPFFTTKNDGTGLGLIIACKIIEDHNGTIDINGKAGIGTVIIVNLPINEYSTSFQ